ncbi:MAG: T9SS type A sorting domain-containing protein [Bacteroidetes bacterium]|nr:T9SS type A sorting domain-containing protein [Bacteroidota bacterium]
MFKILRFFFVFFSFVFVSKAQPTYLMSNVNVALPCPGTGLFYDSGGSAGNYNNNENFTKTFTAPAGSCLQISFNSAYATESGFDFLKIFDGPTGASPLIGTYNGVTGPGIITSSGTSLTFSFTSDGSVVQAGWDATITCMAACSGTPAGGNATNLSPVCPPAGSVGLSVTGAGTGCGITYQWQSGPTAGGPFTTIVGATLSTISVPTSSTTFYRRLTNCGANTGSSTAVSASTFTISCPLSTYAPSFQAYSFNAFVGTVFPSTDDVLFNSIVSFGFPFCFGGAQYWGGYVASNGAFVFDAVPCFPNIQTNQYATAGMNTGWQITQPAPNPTTSIPRNAILAPWQDIDPSLGGIMRYTTLGVAPTRSFVVNFENIPMFSCGTASPGIYYTGQIKLMETTNVIEIHVANKGVCPGWNNGQAVMGLHSHDGLTYIPVTTPTAFNAVASPGPYNQWNLSSGARKFTSPCAGAGGPCVTLPINFKAFYGQQIDAVNKLNWETAREEDVKEFVVERSLDAVNFTEIGKTTPKNLPTLYEFQDVNFKANIVNYYRITAIDNDGSKRSTFVYPIEGNYEKLVVGDIYPNPIKDNFSMSLNSKVLTTVIVSIKDLYGRNVKSLIHSPDFGITKFSMNCSDLSAGIYVVEVTDSNNGKVVSQQKLIVVN